MPDTPSRQTTSSSARSPDRSRASRTSGRAASSVADTGSLGEFPVVDVDEPRAALAQAIPRRPGVSWWLGIVLAVGFAALVTPAITAEHWLLRFGVGTIVEKHAAPFTVRAPTAGYGNLRVGGGVVVARGELATRDEAALADTIAGATPRGPMLYLAFFALTFALAALFTHHMRRSTKGRLARVQLVSLAVIAVVAVAVKLVMLSTALSALVVPLAVLAMVPTLVLDRIVGLATGVLGAVIVSLLAPFDIGLALLLLVQTAAAGLVIAERPKRGWLPALTAGLVATLCTCATYLLLTYLTSGHAPELRDLLHSPWLAAAIGPAIAALLAAPLVPIYQLLVGEITQSKLIALEDLGHPLLRRIAEKAPGTWQHSLMMANMAEIAANAIGANGRLVRVGAYFHDLGKSLQPKYFIENLEAGETSPHDLLPPEVSCDAIFAHVTGGIVTARKAGLHERIVDFMHMHHGNGVLEYFWAKCREQGNPHGLTVEQFRYPGHPPQSRETALLAICDAVEAASRTLRKPDPAAIDSLVQRIVYGKLHLGQLDESGLSMSDLRRINDSLRETIRHANHGRIEYPWQKAAQDASASVAPFTTTAPRLDSLDRQPIRDSTRPATAAGNGNRHSNGASDSDAALAATADVKDPGGPAAVSRPEGSDAGRIRAGTARNVQPSDAQITEAITPRREPRTAAALHDPVDDDAIAARMLGLPPPGTGESVLRAAERPPALIVEQVEAAVPGRKPTTTLLGRIPGSSGAAAAVSDASAARAIEREVVLEIEAEEPAPGRDPATTLPGRAPGPPPGSQDGSRPRDLEGDAALGFEVAPGPDRDVPITGPGAPTIAASSTASRHPAITLTGRAPGPSLTTLAGGGAGAATPAEYSTAPVLEAPAPTDDAANIVAGRAPDVATAPPADRDIATTPGRGPPDSMAPAVPDEPQARGRGATPPPPPRRTPTTPPPAANRSAGDSARSAGPPGPVDLDNATTNPPPLRRGPTGHPSVPSDPAQLAAALANLVARVSAAPFGKAGDTDAAVTQPELPALRAEPPPPRATGLAEVDPRPGQLQTLRGHGEDSGALRRPADPAAATPADDDARVTVPQAATAPPAADPPHNALRDVPAAHDPDAGITEPSMPVLEVGDQRRIDVPVRPARAAAKADKPGWAEGLAARIDAALDVDDWGHETPVVAPTKAELRALLGQPDPTRQQPIDEIELLQRRAAELGDGAIPRRSPHPTTEVDPDDIEAAIELAPPARRPTHPNAVSATKPRKPG